MPRPRPSHPHGRPRGGGSGRPRSEGGSGRPTRASRPNAPGASGGSPRPGDDGLERLQKVLAAAGIGSRRACEELITAGRVEVDRTVVTALGTRVDPRTQEVRVDGEKLPRVRRLVFLLNKPVGVVTTNYDPAGRPRAVDLVPTDQRLFAIGRLDRSSEGLLLLTNDGELANLLAHPRYGVEKKYLVQVAGVPGPEVIDQLRRGVHLAEGEVHAKRVTLRTQHKQSAVLEMVLDEGRNREIRRMLARLGHKVQQLKRVAVGGLSLGTLLPGQWRQLPWSEVETLRRDALAAVGPAALSERPASDRRGDRRAGRRVGAKPGRKPAGRPRDGGSTGGGSRPAPRPAKARPPKGRPGRPRRPGKASTWRAAQRSAGRQGGVAE
jgi:23S rRNA pseudouridine2605 synthase